MKKRGMFIFFVLLIFSFAAIISADSSTNQTKVNNAYTCLNNRVSGNCSSFTTEEKSFIVLATGQCQSELMSDSYNSGQCWPSSSCTVKATAEAILALKNAGTDTEAAEDWLLSQNATATGITWYLEIDSQNATSCSVKYPSGQPYKVNINDNKQLSGGAGSCLTLSPDGYLLKVSPSCYGQDFSISCSNDFLTTTLFQKTTTSTIYVSDQTSSAASGGTTTENVKSYCFANKGVCDYEGSLWSALVLNSKGVDVSAYLPYLITSADDNQRYLPDAFLYAITADNNYEVSLLSKQESSEYWMESGNKYYDTALALYPLQQESPQEKINAENWLQSSQDPQGCWENNVRDTAFILASVWPGQTSGTSGTTTSPDCTSNGYYCTTSTACTGTTLGEYSCPSSLNICCSIQPPLETCSQQGGSLCSSTQQCNGGSFTTSSDSTGSYCCVNGGSCLTPTTSQCESNSGICRIGSCQTGEQENTNYECSIQGDICCTTTTTTTTSGGSTLWIWILIILIILVAVGILFRDKLRKAWNNMRKGKQGPAPGAAPYRPYMPPPRYIPPMRVPERRIIPPPSTPQSQPQPIRRMPSKSQKELDEVLKKLKDMGK